MDKFPSQKEFLSGVSEFCRHEKRDAMYRVATKLVAGSWGNWEEVTDGLGVLLLTWNQALYRYGIFDFDKLESFLKKRQDDINSFRSRSLESLSKQDEGKIKILFGELLRALTSEGKDKKQRKSPVAVAKALHLLAPGFFPIWDNAIAREYGCYWMTSDQAPEEYIAFCRKNKDFMAYLIKEDMTKPEGKSWVKLIDEYNYAKFTYQWI